MNSDKKVGNLNVSYLNTIRAAPEAAYEVGCSLSLTISGPTEEERTKALVDFLNEQQREEGQYYSDSSEEEQRPASFLGPRR